MRRQRQFKNSKDNIFENVDKKKNNIKDDYERIKNNKNIKEAIIDCGMKQIEIIKVMIVITNSETINNEYREMINDINDMFDEYKNEEDEDYLSEEFERHIKLFKKNIKILDKNIQHFKNVVNDDKDIETNKITYVNNAILRWITEFGI